jgi:hypothetical protein
LGGYTFSSKNKSFNKPSVSRKLKLNQFHITIVLFDFTSVYSKFEGEKGVILNASKTFYDF